MKAIKITNKMKKSNLIKILKKKSNKILNLCIKNKIIKII